MKKIKIILSSFIFFFVPLISSAQGTIQALTISIGNLFSYTILPVMITIAFAFFIYNTIRYFVIESGNEEGREKARSLALYGVLAFVFLISFFGLINFFSTSIGLQGTAQPYNDYEVYYNLNH